MENLGKEEISSNAILSGITCGNLSIVRQKFTAVDIKKSYRNLALRFHPDRCLDKPKEEQTINASLFGAIHDAYCSLIEPVRFNNELPYAIDWGYYKPLDEYEPEKSVEKLWMVELG